MKAKKPIMTRAIIEPTTAPAMTAGLGDDELLGIRIGEVG